MAKKKTRRPPRRSTPRMYGDQPPAAAPMPAASGSPAAATAAVARPSAASARTMSAVVRSNEPLSVEYRYVAGDLKRLGFTALTFFAVLIAAGVIAYLLQR
jgi:hypothetical protein